VAKGSIRSGKESRKDLSNRGPFFSKFFDFFYFNDFYILSTLLIAALVYIILKSIR
jgi:hypothetical protein